DTGSSVAPCSTLFCTASQRHTKTERDGGSFVCPSCVDDGAGGAAQKCADVTTPGTQSPALSITKVATESGFSAVGEVIHYTIVAKNTDNRTAHAGTVADSQVSELVSVPANGSSLAPGTTRTCTYSHGLTRAVLYFPTRRSSDLVDDGAGGAAQKCADVTTPGTQSPALSITKVATESGFSAVGEVIHYTIVAKNTGDRKSVV